MLGFIKDVTWRIYQMSLMLFGMILSSVSGVFSDGWHHVFGIFIFGFLFSYFANILTVILIDHLCLVLSGKLSMGRISECFVLSGPKDETTRQLPEEKLRVTRR